MRLNPDCIRDVLLDIEKRASIDISYNMKWIIVQNIFTDLSVIYSPQEVFYTIRKLNEGGYIEVVNESRIPNRIDLENYHILDITYKGHQFLNSIRDNKIWSKLKPKASAMTLTVIQTVAERLILSNLGV